MEEDKRFANIKTDPKFRRIPKSERKVKIDKRFQSMFKDKQFKVKYTTDKRGRPISKTSTEDLRRYYELESEESDESSESESDNDDEEKEATQSELIKSVKSDKKIPDKIKKRLQNLNVDYARGESILVSESSSDDEDSDEEVSEVDDIDHRWGELDADAATTEEATYRLAACNMDWDRMRAVDLMVLLSSFLPQGSVIKSVKIYPSEFGKKRLKEEEIKGPTELVELKNENDNENLSENEDGSKYHMEKLRQYQLNRLKYYYAVISFDNATSANKVYTECDGMEYESSATKLDLRFIPDDMTFDDEPKEVCEKLPDLNKYQPRFFTTTALQQAKVDLTWDETNPDRLEIAEKLNSGKLNDITEEDLQNYLAGSSDEEISDDNENNDVKSDNESDENPINKYKALLQDIESNEKQKKNNEVEMEVTWGIDLKEKTEKLVKKKMEESENLTPFQQYLNKRKEKRKEKRQQQKEKLNNSDDSDIPSDIDLNDPYFVEEFNNPEFKKKKSKPKLKNHSDEEDNQKQSELELLLLDSNENDKKHFNLKKIQENENDNKSKKKKKKQKGANSGDNNDQEDNFKINVSDERFTALYTSHHYNIDPTDPHFKKTKGMETIISEKLKRRNDFMEETEKLGPANKKSKSNNKKDAELNVLVKSVKRKTEALKNKSSK